jgi:hypothetical protein
MHLLIPFAFCCSRGCASLLPTLKLPRLEKLLMRLTPEPLDSGNEFSLSPPHERALARVLGLPVADGQIAWAARQARSASGSWGFITPCHWRTVGKHAAMSGLTLPDFSALESQTLLAAMQAYFEEDGITLNYLEPNCWLAHGELLAGLATASLDRVVGRDIANWLPRGANAIRLQRLQAEMQMLLYTHPVNDQRAARGVSPVNSLWLSGTGSLDRPAQKATFDSEPSVVNTLREPALNEDWASWAQAWTALDSTECAAMLRALEQGGKVQLTLCGERHAQTYCSSPTGYLKRLANLFGKHSAQSALEQL